MWEIGCKVCWKEQGKVVRTVQIGSASSEQAVEKLVKKAQAVVDKGKAPLFNLKRFDKK